MPLLEMLGINIRLLTIVPVQATFHGLTPSRGADVDKNLKQEDELRLKEKGY